MVTMYGCRKGVHSHTPHTDTGVCDCWCHKPNKPNKLTVEIDLDWGTSEDLAQLTEHLGDYIMDRGELADGKSKWGVSTSLSFESSG